METTSPEDQGGLLCVAVQMIQFFPPSLRLPRPSARRHAFAENQNGYFISRFGMAADSSPATENLVVRMSGDHEHPDGG
jgi:hypothetical protein